MMLKPPALSPDNQNSKEKTSVHVVTSPRFKIPLVNANVSLNAVLAIVSYAATSLSIILFNKMILSVYKFKYEALMTLGHMISCVIFSEIFRFLGWVNYPPFRKDLLLKVAPLSLFFVLNVVIGLLALRVVNVPMFTTLRRLSGLVILILEWLVLGIVPSSKKVMSLGIILFGAVIAGAGDLTFDLVSYSYVMVNNMFTAGYLIAIKKLDKGEPKLNANAKVYYNSLISIPWLVIIALLDGEFAAISKYEFLWDGGFQIGFFFSCLLAYFVNSTTFWCTSATNALTTSVTGQLKNILTTILGMFLFGDVQPTGLLVVGLLVGIGGSVWFSYVETTKNQPKPTPKTKTVDLELPENEPLKNGEHERDD